MKLLDLECMDRQNIILRSVVFLVAALLIGPRTRQLLLFLGLVDRA